jgi:hypothetical protein
VCQLLLMVLHAATPSVLHPGLEPAKACTHTLSLLQRSPICVVLDSILNHWNKTSSN